jgi:hypothetical protein
MGHLDLWRIDRATFLDRLGFKAGALDSIRFARGVVPNTTYALCFSVIAMAAAGWSFGSNPEIAFKIVLTIGSVAIVFILGTWIFAHIHPDIALLGGAQLLKLRELEYAAKGMPQPPTDPIIEDPDRPPPRISQSQDAPDEQ